MFLDLRALVHTRVVLSLVTFLPPSDGFLAIYFPISAQQLLLLSASNGGLNSYAGRVGSGMYFLRSSCGMEP